MRIDLHCPIEVTGYELLHDDRGKARAYVKLFNLSAQRVTRLEAVAHFTDEGGGEACQRLRADAINAGPRQAFSLTVPASELPGATGVWMAFTRLGFESGRPDWVGHPSRLTEVRDMPAPDGRDLNKLIAVAGRDAVCFPWRTGAFWVCVCARPNAYRRKTCARCGRDRDRVLTECDMASVLKSPRISTPSGDTIELPLMRGGAPSPRPESAQERLRRKFVRQRALLIRRTITMLAVALLLALAAWAVSHFGGARQPEQYIPPVKAQQSDYP